ncbi:Solute carrier family 2, facilitated glucose transporter member 11 [Acipenser ruthenus]|uniref:Solute carrier family 2, facilitated glucose transporter member 11 n=1 Tax=Acipenser ruthenus TaxID=7906 RepID=A0A444UYD6_ACIRT|nr:Solute carrier family 2, facilitated glucose transporter member 11 [Acipenser ruthenus]
MGAMTVPPYYLFRSIKGCLIKPVQSFINETWIHRYGTNIQEGILTLLWSVIVSVFTLGGFIGSSVGGMLAIRFGRKGALLLNSVFALLASLLMGLSYPTGVFELLIVGRFLIGLNAGIGICVQPLYLGEIAPKSLRGAMAMGTSIFITGGILTGQVVGLKYTKRSFKNVFSDRVFSIAHTALFHRELLGGDDYWPMLLSTSCIPAILQFLILPWFPESPRYLLIDKGDDIQCSKALKQLHGSESYHYEREDMEQERVAMLGVKPKKPWELFMDPNLRWQLLTIMLLNFTQQLSGINAIYFYANYVFTRAGIPVEKIPYITIGTGACECLTALTCDANPWVPYLSMSCVFAFILSFGLGPGGVTNILNTELFTQPARPAAYMIGGSVNWLSFFFIGMIFPFIVNGLQQYCFLVFLVNCCLVAIYIFFAVPETKNKTFLQIEQEFQALYGSKRNAEEASVGNLSELLNTADM